MLHAMEHKGYLTSRVQREGRVAPQFLQGLARSGVKPLRLAGSRRQYQQIGPAGTGGIIAGSSLRSFTKAGTGGYLASDHELGASQRFCYFGEIWRIVQIKTAIPRSLLWLATTS
jgi:hypothetical protein